MAVPPKAEITAPPGMPQFIASLSPELQLQWWLKTEEAKAAVAAKEAAAAAAVAAEEAKTRQLLAIKQAEADVLLQRLKLEAELKAVDLEKQRLAVQAAADADAAAKAHEMALRKLELEARTPTATVTGVPTPGGPVFRLDQAIKLVPRFNERNVEEYLISFEKIAALNNWPADCYAAVLQAVLTGKFKSFF